MRKIIGLITVILILMNSCATKTIDLTDEFNSVKGFFNDIGTKRNEGRKDGENWDLSKLDTAIGIDSLSDEEKSVILELNKVRSDPKKYAELYLVPLKRGYSGNNYQKGGVTILTNEGRAALDESIKVLSNSHSSGLLNYNKDLYNMAKDQVDKQGSTKLTGHDSPNGDTFQDRARIWSNGIGCVGENISYGESIARDIVIQLLIDDGVPSRGHRKNILQKNYDLAGVSIGKHKQYSYMCVIDFGKI